MSVVNNIIRNKLFLYNTCNTILVWPMWITPQYCLLNIFGGYAGLTFNEGEYQYIKSWVLRMLSNDDGGRHDGEVGFHLNSTHYNNIIVYSFHAKAEMAKCRRLYNGIYRTRSSNWRVLADSVLRAEDRIKYIIAIMTT